MNKKFTHRENRNFVSKISDFFKILPAIPADMITAGIIAIVQNTNLSQAHIYLKTSIAGSNFNAVYSNGFAKECFYGQHIFINFKSK